MRRLDRARNRLRRTLALMTAAAIAPVAVAVRPWRRPPTPVAAGGPA